MDEKQIDRLLVKISYGDNAAFEELYNGTKRGVFSFIYSYLRHYENTEDAMQTVYLKVKQNIGQYVHGTNGRAWLLQIAKNQAINELNKNKRIEFNDDIVVAADPISDECGVMSAMAKVLTEEEQRIVLLHVLWGYRHREIAVALDCPTGTVTSKYKRSIAKLKQALKEERS